MKKWIWQEDNWPQFVWDKEEINLLISPIEKKQFILLGKASATPVQTETLDSLVKNIVASSAIENEFLNPFSLRSSLAKKLGLDNYDTSLITPRSDGLAQLTLESLQNFKQPLSLGILFKWHKLLFSSSDDLFNNIKVGSLRGSDPMQVISGRLDKPKIHFEAPPRDLLEKELNAFLDWFNNESSAVHTYIKAALTHLWFLTLHPFDDGNGRLARALTDRVLAENDSQTIRLYSLAPSILQARKSYYEILENTQKGLGVQEPLDITNWIKWFLAILETSIDTALNTLDKSITKAKFWLKHKDTQLSDEQKKVLNRMLDGGENGFELGINTTQYHKVAKVSKPTATRHLAYLVEQGCLVRLEAGGRSTRYKLKTEDL